MLTQNQICCCCVILLVVGVLVYVFHSTSGKNNTPAHHPGNPSGNLSGNPSGPSMVRTPSMLTANPTPLIPKPTLLPSQLLPTTQKTDGSGGISNVNILAAGQLQGINTQMSSNRNPSYDLRPEPKNPTNPTGPWNQNTISEQ
jgi:hypothetical protein